MQYVYSYDLGSLRELWSHLDTRMFSRLDIYFVPGIKKLENAVLKMYLVNAIVNNRHDRIQDFFNKMAPVLQGHAEWKEWFGTFLSSHMHENFKSNHTHVYATAIILTYVLLPFVTWALEKFGTQY